MARKVADVTITEEGRDKGKTFVLTEMPARRAEKFGQRMAAALIRAMAGDTSAYEAVLDEEISCVQIRPDPSRPEILRPLIDEDVEEIATLRRLRREVADLHMGFYVLENLSKLTSATNPEGSSITPTSRESSEQ